MKYDSATIREGEIPMRHLIVPLAIVAMSVVTVAMSAQALPAQDPTVTPTSTSTPYPVKDQDTCTSLPQGGAASAGLTWKAQTFVPDVSGRLIRVEIPGLNTGGTTTLHIRNTRNGSPVGPDLGSASVLCGNSFDFGDGIALTAGQLYALVLSHSGGLHRYEWQYSSSTTCYPNPLGYPFTSTDGGNTWGQDIVDFYFTTFMLPNSSTGTPAPPFAPTCAPTQTPGPGLTRPQAYVISFPVSTPANDPQLLTEELILRLREASMYHGYANRAAPPYLEYDIYGDTVIRETALPPKLPNGMYDVGAVYGQHHLCDLIQAGQVDEVWLWDAGQGGFAEWETNGPEWSLTWGSGVPDCGKQVTTMIFNYNRELDVALESYNHRLEGFFMHYFPCEFWTATWPWTGWPPKCTGFVSDRYGYVARAFSGNDHIAVCGDAHHPPNILDDHSYDYSNMTAVQSICEDWQWDGTATVKAVDCREWACNHAGFHIWWMQNLPGLNNTNRNRYGTPQPNWWAYLFGRPIETPTVTATSSPSHTPSATPGITPTPSFTPTSTLTMTATATPTFTMTVNSSVIYLPMVLFR